jgi:hypothetical protein
MWIGCSILGPNASLSMFDFFQNADLRGISQDPSGSGTHHKIPTNRGGQVLGPLLGAYIASITMNTPLFAIEQGVGLGYLVDIGRGGDNSIGHTRFGPHAGSTFMPKNQIWPILVRCISGPRPRSWVLVKVGIAMIVATTIVPTLSIRPISVMMVSDIVWVS